VRLELTEATVPHEAWGTQFRPEPSPSPSGEISQSLIAHGHSQTHEARDGDHVTGQDPVARKLRMRSELKFWFVLR
jgi:hypothetical protein